MPKEIIVDRDKTVTITVEKGAKRTHYIEIRRKYESNNVLLDKKEVLNGAQNKLTFEYSSIALVSSFVLIPTYVKDNLHKESTLVTTHNLNANHTIFNFGDDKPNDDQFDLQIHFIVQ